MDSFLVISDELIKNRIEENYHLIIEVSAIGIDCEVLMTLVKICNNLSMYFQCRDSFYQQKMGYLWGHLYPGYWQIFLSKTLKIGQEIPIF